MQNLPEYIKSALRADFKYQPCVSCTVPMLGIFKPSADNRGPALAREICEPCVRIEHLRGVQGKPGIFERILKIVSLAR